MSSKQYQKIQRNVFIDIHAKGLLNNVDNLNKNKQKKQFTRRTMPIIKDPQLSKKVYMIPSEMQKEIACGNRENSIFICWSHIGTKSHLVLLVQILLFQFKISP